MKKLRYITDSAKTEYTKMRQRQNRLACVSSQSENAVNDALRSTGLKWTRQAIWGYRLFDFWCSPLGVAVEVDGPEHKPDYDSYRDEYNFRRSAIVVLRVNNGDNCRIREMVSLLPILGTHKDRRAMMGLNGKDCKRLAELPEYPRLLPAYLEAMSAGLQWKPPNTKPRPAAPGLGSGEGV